jgi:hypothetical protein
LINLIDTADLLQVRMGYLILRKYQLCNVTHNALMPYHACKSICARFPGITCIEEYNYTKVASWRDIDRCNVWIVLDEMESMGDESLD